MIFQNIIIGSKIKNKNKLKNNVLFFLNSIFQQIYIEKAQKSAPRSNRRLVS